MKLLLSASISFILSFKKHVLSFLHISGTELNQCLCLLSPFLYISLFLTYLRITWSLTFYMLLYPSICLFPIPSLHSSAILCYLLNLFIAGMCLVFVIFEQFCIFLNVEIPLPFFTHMPILRTRKKIDNSNFYKSNKPTVIQDTCKQT